VHRRGSSRTGTGAARGRRTAAWLGLALAAASCHDRAPADAIPVGLLLSYSGSLAANSINVERAFLMALEAASAAGGLGGRPVTMVARDTGSDASKVLAPARELFDAGVALMVGPDTPDLAVPLKPLLAEKTLILPSYTTASNFSKPHAWFVMGASAARVACELFAQLSADGRKRPLVIADPNGYNSLLAFELTKTYAIPWQFLPSAEPSTEMTVQPILAAGADAFVLAALPPSASSLVYALAAVGALADPARFYLSPTLHTPALLETIPQGMLQGARGVASGTYTQADVFQARFAQRWQDRPLDDAYSFYDAGALAVLAMQRALVQEGSIPPGTGLARHLVAVTSPQGIAVGWDEIGRGLALLREGQEIRYLALSGPLLFDITGQTASAATHWWTIDLDGFDERDSESACP
jgi:ABC-type branched-subunit amino acid transport system substrate-binding protein